MLKFAFHNLGCKVNAYETDAMIQMLLQAGYMQVPFKEGAADIYIINTCSVTNIADRKSRQMIHRARSKNPDAVVVAAGCYVQARGEEIQKEEAVDIVIGNNRKKDIVSILEQYLAEHKKIYDLADMSREKVYEDLFVGDISGHTRAYIKIQDGCNQFCSYCIIPYVRGRVRSREIESILAEVSRLAAGGFKEFVLTGIHLSSYGAEWETPRLIDVIKEVSRIPGVERIRLGSLEPRIITEDFAAELAGIRQLCPHFHLSLQSGCDATLKRMNRRYDTQEYAKKCSILRDCFLRPAITTDVIVGFPGETQEEFSETKKFLEEMHFFEMHVFSYSRRKGTAADRMDGQVEETVKNARSQELLALDKRMSHAYRAAFIGSREEVLIEEMVDFGGEGYALGHTPAYIKVLIPAASFGTNPACIVNRIVPVQIQGFADEQRMMGGLTDGGKL